jgi:hypothetical protein
MWTSLALYIAGLLVTAGAMGHLLRGRKIAERWPEITFALALWPLALPLVLAWLVLLEVRKER